MGEMKENRLVIALVMIRWWLAERRLLGGSTAEPHDDLGLELPRHLVGLGSSESCRWGEIKGPTVGLLNKNEDRGE